MSEMCKLIWARRQTGHANEGCFNVGTIPSRAGRRAFSFRKGAKMRLLIGIYLAFGVVCLLCVALLEVLGIHAILTKQDGPHHRNNIEVEELVGITCLMLGVASLPLTAAYGLWRRWQLMRLVLMGLGWWSIGCCVFISVVALAHWAGLIDGSSLLANEPLGETLTIAAAAIGFYGWQYWVLSRPAIRHSFLKLAAPVQVSASDESKSSP